MLIYSNNPAPITSRFRGSVAIVAALRAAAQNAPEFSPAVNLDFPMGAYSLPPCEHVYMEDGYWAYMPSHGPVVPEPDPIPRVNVVAHYSTGDGSRGSMICENIRSRLLLMADRIHAKRGAFDGAPMRKPAIRASARASAPHVSARAMWEERDYAGALTLAENVGDLFFGSSAKNETGSFPYMACEPIEAAGHSFIVARSIQTGKFRVLHARCALSVDSAYDFGKGFATASKAIVWILERAEDENWCGKLNAVSAKAATFDQVAARAFYLSDDAGDPVPVIPAPVQAIPAPANVPPATQTTADQEASRKLIGSAIIEQDLDLDESISLVAHVEAGGAVETWTRPITLSVDSGAVAYPVPCDDQRINDAWSPVLIGRVEPSEYQAHILECLKDVHAGIRAQGKYPYNSDAWPRIAALMALRHGYPDASVEATEGGWFGTHCYKAGQLIRRGEETKREREAAASFKVAQIFPRLIFNDAKQVTGAHLLEMSDSGYHCKLSGKRGGSVVTITCTASALQAAIDRARVRVQLLADQRARSKPAAVAPPPGDSQSVSAPLPVHSAPGQSDPIHDRPMPAQAAQTGLEGLSDPDLRAYIEGCHREQQFGIDFWRAARELDDRKDSGAWTNPQPTQAARVMAHPLPGELNAAPATPIRALRGAEPHQHAKPHPSSRTHATARADPPLRIPASPQVSPILGPGFRRFPNSPGLESKPSLWIPPGDLRGRISARFAPCYVLQP